MTELLLLKLLHILFFVYWLGGDLGTFYASRFVTKPGLSAQQRATAMTIMMGVDQGPRLCMTMILAPGIHLASKLGLMPLPGWAIVLIWGLCLVWFALVLGIHLSHAGKLNQLLGRIDLVLRIVVISSCLAVALNTLLDNGFILADWLAYKLIMFALLVSAGLGIRMGLKPFGPAFGNMLKDGVSDSTDAIMNASLAKVRPFVYFIWAGLLVNAALGMHLIGM